MSFLSTQLHKTGMKFNNYKKMQMTVAQFYGLWALYLHILTLTCPQNATIKLIPYFTYSNINLFPYSMRTR